MKYSKTCRFKRDCVKAVTVAEFNEIITEVKERGGKIYLEKFIKPIHQVVGFNAFVEDKLKYCTMTTRYKGVVATFVCDKSTGNINEANKLCSQGMNAYNILVRMMPKDKRKYICKLVSDMDLIEGKNSYPFSASPFLWFNPRYNLTEQKAVGYDMNSAYSYAMLQPIPDTSKVPSVRIACYNEGVINEGEIGFNSRGELLEVGDYAMFRFNAVESPFKKFVAKYFSLKYNATNPEERKRAKDVLNLSVGYFQRINPFIRACIVGRANNLIRSLIDENTLYCNTDSIVSLKPRDDLKLGKNIGEWKIEHEGVFRYVEMTYQWNDELPAYRGIPKEYFKKGYNLLRDPIPNPKNLYRFDIDKLKLVKEKL